MVQSLKLHKCDLPFCLYYYSKVRAQRFIADARVNKCNFPAKYVNYFLKINLKISHGNEKV